MQFKMNKMRHRIFRMLFPDVQKFLLDLYAMPRDPSYFVQLPSLPENIKDLLKE